MVKRKCTKLEKENAAQGSGVFCQTKFKGKAKEDKVTERKRRELPQTVNPFAGLELY